MYILAQKLKEMSTHDVKLSPFEKLRAEVLKFLSEELFTVFLASPQTKPLHEALFFDDVMAVKHHIVGSPRQAILRGLRDPHFYLDVRFMRHLELKFILATTFISQCHASIFLVWLLQIGGSWWHCSNTTWCQYCLQAAFGKWKTDQHVWLAAGKFLFECYTNFAFIWSGQISMYYSYTCFLFPSSHFLPLWIHLVLMMMLIQSCSILSETLLVYALLVFLYLCVIFPELKFSEHDSPVQLLNFSF